MEDAQPNSSAVTRRAAVLLTALLFILAAGKAILFDTLDPDCFWHLKVAEQLQVQGVGPIVDTLSYSSLKEPWTPYSWLAEFAMKWTWDHLGWQGAVLSQALLQGAFAAIVMQICLMRSGNRIVASACATFCALLWTLPFLSFRPVTMALVPMAWCAWAVLRERQSETGTRSVWLIIPLTVLTTNLHLSACFISIWCAAMCAGAWMDRNRDQTRRFGALTILTAVACCCTPMLGGAIHTALFYAQQDAMVASPIISEMQSFYAGTMGKINLLVVVALAAFAIRRTVLTRTIGAGETIWLLFGAVLIAKMCRFAPMFILIGAPIAAIAFSGLRDRILAKPAIQWALLATVVLALGRLFISLPNQSTSLSSWLNRLGPETPGYPTAAADFVAASVHRDSGRIINEFNWGGYLGWRLGDQYQTLLDGRTQVFSRSFWERSYLGTTSQKRDLLAGSNADAAIVPIAKSEFGIILRKMGWTTAFKDDRAEVLLPPVHPVAGANE